MQPRLLGATTPPLCMDGSSFMHAKSRHPLAFSTRSNTNRKSICFNRHKQARLPLTLAASSSSAAATTSSATYSRTSWRDAILSEAQSSQDPDQPPDSSIAGLPPFPPPNATAGSSGNAGGSSDLGRENGDGADGGGAITASELRVKLSLAGSSGRLDLTDCRLREVPHEVWELTELEELQLSGNCLTALPDGLSRLKALRRLGLAGNRLTALPPSIGQLTALEGLWLHGNALSTLPPQLGRLGALRALSLAGNCLEQLPPGCLSGLTSLTDLTLAGNRLTALPPGELAPLSALRKLALNGNRLGQGTGGDSGADGGGCERLGVGAHMTGLTELMLQGNCLEQVDPAIFECPALSELSLADNCLTSLPPTLPAASSLARLHLFGNRLTTLPVAQLAALPTLSSLWLEGNPLGGSTVRQLLTAARAGGGSMPRLKALGLDQSQMAAAGEEEPSSYGVAAGTAGVEGIGSAVQQPLPASVRVGCVLASGPGYFKLHCGPQRAEASSGGAKERTEKGAEGGGKGWAIGGGEGGGAGGGRSSNDVLVVAFGSAPGTPNWGGLLSKVYRAATAEGERHFDVLYVADPARDWYGGGDELSYQYYRSRLAAYTTCYRRVLLLGDSMGATAALMFSDLATSALAFCPQVDLTTASIRPGRSPTWWDVLRRRLLDSVAASHGKLVVLVGTWQHDLAQANLLPQKGQAAQQEQGQGGGLARGGWRERQKVADANMEGARRGLVGSAAQRSPWRWQQEEGKSGDGEVLIGGQGSEGVDAEGALGGVNVRVFSVDSHRLAAALDARGKLVSLVRDAILHELGLRSGNVRVSNLL